ncbi:MULTISPECIES: hypothetical protein [Clostridium]|uniref:Uncharacterized protein n=1 Tax=Clostridium beijerinckii TaxID=1520 RepID=A0A7X9XRD1_CLOBE|nr:MULTISPECIES: hypothetical protein [Clostridium]NMF07323.1 hypothetical protein [Clostridium beijerinckii]
MIRKQVSGSVKPRNGIVVKSSKSNKTVVIKKIMPIVEEGLYNAKVIDVEIVEPKMTKQGLTGRTRVGFRLEDGREIYSNLLLMWNKNYPAYQLITNVLGTFEDVDLDDLIGAEVRIEVKHNVTNDGVFANVVSVYSIDGLEKDEDYTESDNLEEYEDNKEFDQNAYDEIEC